MKRDQLEHIIRASAAISGDTELVIIGSQAILGQFPEAPGELLVSMEADVYPKNIPSGSLRPEVRWAPIRQLLISMISPWSARGCRGEGAGGEGS